MTKLLDKSDKYVVVAHLNVYKGPRGFINKDLWQFFDNFITEKLNGKVDVLLFDNNSIENLPNMLDELNKYKGLIISGVEPLKYLGFDSTSLDLSGSEEQTSQDEDLEEDDETDIDDEEDAIDPNNGKLEDVGISKLRDSGIINRNPNLKFSKIDVIFSPRYYIIRDLINVLYFDLLNITNTNTYKPELKEVKSNFHHVSEFESIKNQYFNNGKDIGFDFETRGFPFEANFRFLGFSLANDDYQAYFYYSRDDKTYAEELSSTKDSILSYFKANSHHLWSFNNKFENNAVLDQFDEPVFFEDSRVLVQILKSRGSLKFSANLYLGVPIWNDDINVFMSNYTLFESFVKNFDKVSHEEVFHLDELTNSYSEVRESEYKAMIDELNNTQDISNMKLFFSNDLINKFEDAEKLKLTWRASLVAKDVESKVDGKVVKSKSFDLKIIFSHNSESYLLDESTFMRLSLENLKGNDKSIFKYFLTYSDRMEGKFNLLNLRTYYLNKYNSWQSCGIGDMGHYCILDSYFTVKLKEMLYDSNYQGCRNGYQFYITQSHLAGLIEANRITIDPERYHSYSQWCYSEREKLAKLIGKYPGVVDNISNARYSSALRSELSNIITQEVILLNKKKRVVKRDLGFILNLNESTFDESFLEFYSVYNENRKTLAIKRSEIKTHNERVDATKLKIAEEINSTTDPVIIEKLEAESKSLTKMKSLGKRDSDKILNAKLNDFGKSCIFYMDLINKKIRIGAIENADNTQELLEVVKDSLLKFRSSCQDKVQVDFDTIKKEYLNTIENGSFEDIEKILKFNSNTASLRRVFIDNGTMLGDMPELVLRKAVIGGSSNASKEVIEELKSLTPENISEVLSELVHRDSISIEDKNILITAIQKGQKRLDSYLNGDNFGKMHWRYQKESWEEYYGNFDSIDKYPPHMNLIYNLQCLSSVSKAISTVVVGNMGGKKFIKSSNKRLPPKPQVDGDLYFYGTTYWNNDKDTMRWSSAWHCLTGDTRIIQNNDTIDLETLYQKKLNNESLGNIISIDKKLNQIITPITDIIKSGEVIDLMEVKLNDGSIVKCTPDHRFMTLSGVYIEARHITKHTKIRKIEK